MGIRLAATSESPPDVTTRAPAHVPARGDDNVNAEVLRGYVDRITSLHEQRLSMADDIAEVLQEATGNGFDKKILKEVVKITMQDPDKRAKRKEDEDILAVYCAALGLS